MTIRNGESIIVESTRHKLKVCADGRGDISYTTQADKTTEIKEVLFDEQLKKKLEGYKEGKEKEKAIKFIKELAERGSKALKVDKNKLLALMLENCTYNVFCYFSDSNFSELQDMESLHKQVGDLHQKCWNATRAYEDRLLELQKEVCNAQGIYAGKIEVDGDTYMNYGIHVHCPFCNRWQEVENLEDWHPGEEFEGDQECEECGKPFSITSDGVY